MNEYFTITNKTKSTLPRVPFLSIKERVLGKKYELSLVFIGRRRSRRLNFSYREKNKPTNVLSFTLDKYSGEIFITPEVAKREAKKFRKDMTSFIAFLFIHGMLHLKGMDHGSTMERMERKFLKEFSY
jgi:probable rRNA maturation factor